MTETENTRTGQEVTIYGDDIGYQFSRTKNGKRTVKTTVRNIRLGTYIDGKVHEFGDINWHDRENVLVICRVKSINWWTTCDRADFNSGC